MEATLGGGRRHLAHGKRWEGSSEKAVWSLAAGKARPHSSCKGSGKDSGPAASGRGPQGLAWAARGASLVLEVTVSSLCDLPLMAGSAAEKVTSRRRNEMTSRRARGHGGPANPVSCTLRHFQKQLCDSSSDPPSIN